MKKLLFATLLFMTAACTKEVPETEKKLSKSFEEISVKETVDNFISAYNSGDVEKALSFVDPGYKGFATDSDDVEGLDSFRNDLNHYAKQYRDGKWEIKFDEVTVAGETAYVLTSGSFLMPDPIEKKMSPIYSERALRILKKQKNDGWKIYIYMATPMFSYDEK